LNRHRNYQAVAALARTLSFKLAARELGISQPALSRRIQALENALGESLVLRQAQGAVLTDLGRLVADRADRIVHRIARLERHVERLRLLQEGHVRVGGGPYPTVMLAPLMLAAVGRRFPDLTIHYETEGWRLVIQRLKEGRLDVVVTDAVEAERDQELKVFWLASRRMHVVARADHPLAERRGLSSKAIARYPIATTSLPAWALRDLNKLFGDAWQPSLSCDDVRLLMDYALGTNAVIFLPDQLIQGSEGLARLDVSTRFPDTRWGVIRPANRSPSPATQAVIEVIRQLDARL
jgi:DNA-binding transcriptional LysR family regulator